MHRKIVSKSFKFIKKYALKLLLENNNKIFLLSFQPSAAQDAPKTGSAQLSSRALAAPRLQPGPGPAKCRARSRPPGPASWPIQSRASVSIRRRRAAGPFRGPGGCARPQHFAGPGPRCGLGAAGRRAEVWAEPNCRFWAQ